MANGLTENGQMVILQDELQLYGSKKEKYEIKITETCISCTLVSENSSKLKSLSLEFKDIIGCDCMKGRSADDTSAYLTVYAYPHKKKIIGKKTARGRETLTMNFSRKNSFEENQKDAKIWKTAVSALLQDISVTSIQDIVTLTDKPPRKMLVLVNPFSGPGRALQIFQQKVVPIFAEACVHFEMIITERQNHATELAKSLNLDQWYGIVIVSGDGLIYEVVNGLMQRPDWEQAIKMPLGCIPGGSGNALCCSINRECGEPWMDNIVLHSSFILIKHKVKPMDLVAVDTIEGRIYSFLSVTWGLVADIDIESERFRRLGSARFTVEAVARVINLRQYRGRLSYLPIEGEAGSVHRPGLQRSATTVDSGLRSEDRVPQRSTSVVNVPFNNKDSMDNVENGLMDDSEESQLEKISGEGTVNGTVDSQDPLRGNIESRSTQNGNENEVKVNMPPLSEPVPGNWVVLEDDFIHVSACYLPLIGADTLIAPESKLNDGVIYLCFTRVGRTSKKQLMMNLVNMESGNHLKDPAFEVVKVKAFRLEPQTPNGHVCVDGEKVPYGPVQAEVLPGLARVMAL